MDTDTVRQARRSQSGRHQHIDPVGAETPEAQSLERGEPTEDRDPAGAGAEDRHPSVRLAIDRAGMGDMDTPVSRLPSSGTQPAFHHRGGQVPQGLMAAHHSALPREQIRQSGVVGASRTGNPGERAVIRRADRAFPVDDLRRMWIAGAPRWSGRSRRK